MLNKLSLIIAVLFVASCNWNTNSNKYEDFNEDDYFKAQGIVVKKKVRFNYVDKFKKDIEFLYFLELKSPLSAVAKDEPFFDPGDPIVVMMRKKDSTDVFIAHRGIFNEDLLLEYLTREDSDYLNRLDD